MPMTANLSSSSFRPSTNSMLSIDTLSIDTSNIVTFDISDTTLKCDVLIIGAGLAGLSTALSLPSHLKVVVLSKKALNDCSSHYAQGGIAASLSIEDSVADHLQDTLIAGDGLCDDDNSQAILTDGADAVAWLQALGVPFTMNSDLEQNHPLSQNGLLEPNSSLANLPTANKDDIGQPSAAQSTAWPTDLHLTQEGGHGRRRVAHADDATGRYIMQALQQKANEASNISILTGMEALELMVHPIAAIKSTTDLESLANSAIATQKPNTNQCQGALVWDSQQQQCLTISSQAVVLASGGLGQLFKRATAPDVCMGDGMMMAWHAGCRLANLEFVQFHPTGLALDNSNFLISEAVRGEGGYLRCPISGKRFMQDYDARLELAPRDIVARAIADQISQNGLGYVHLDISHQPADFIHQHFPQIACQLIELGIDMTCEPIPVAPSAHYTCGGVIATADGLTDVIGLYAAGEVAYTGLHGANRLASNSLLECVVVGRRIAQHLPTYIKTAAIDDNKADCVQQSLRWHASCWIGPNIKNSSSINLKTPVSETFSFNSLSLSAHPTASKALGSEARHFQQVQALKSLMSTHLGIIRDQPRLQAALNQLQQWHLDAEQITTPKPSVDWLNQWRWQRLLMLAILMLQSALSREESRGGHFRMDCPEKSKLAKVSVINSSHAHQTIATSLSPLHTTAFYINALNQQTFFLKPPAPVTVIAVA